MNTIEITKVNALKAYNGTDKNGKELLENLLGKGNLSQKITDRIKTFEDACAEIGFVPSSNKIAFGFAEDKDVISIIAYSQLCIIARALNEGWEPDWNDSNQDKYFPYFNNHKSGFGFSYSHYDRWYTSTTVGSRLCFKNRELAEYAGTQFLEIYNQFLIIK